MLGNYHFEYIIIQFGERLWATFAQKPTTENPS